MDVRRGWLRYVVAAAVTIVFVPLARVLSDPLGLGHGAIAPLPLILPVIFSSWFGGRGPGLFSVACGVAAEP